MTKFQAASFKSLVEPIFQRLETCPDKLAVLFINNQEKEERISIKHLHTSAAAYARALKEADLKPGELALIAAGHCKDMLFAFWGVLYAGAVPSIFTYKSPMNTTASYIERLKEMVQYSEASIVITNPDWARLLGKTPTGINCRVLSTGDVKIAADDPDIIAYLKPTSFEQTAYLQYTSGTTGMQKGVKLSHRAILNFIQAAAKALKTQDDDVVVNWLPLYHDFGLFAGLIFPLFCVIPTVLISPFKWLRNPKILLQAINNYRGTISFLPNSAHNHMVRCISPRSLNGLDLSSLRVLFNGAEPVLYESQEIFLKKFAPFGLKESALVSGYGMAENTLAVTFSKVGRRSPVDWVSLKEMKKTKKAEPVSPFREGAKANVSSGIPLTGTEVAIIDDKSRRLPERNTGEIIFRSPSLFSGYRKRPELTGQLMKNGWYHSGDLGYMADGELYVCGRKKDMIIIGGHNIYPEDLEAIAGKVPGIYPGAVVAFSLPDEESGSEKIIMICGLEHTVMDTKKFEIERALRRRVTRELGVTVGEVHLRSKSWIVKTQNGKIARALNRDKYIKLIAGRGKKSKQTVRIKSVKNLEN